MKARGVDHIDVVLTNGVTYRLRPDVYEFTCDAGVRETTWDRSFWSGDSYPTRRTYERFPPDDRFVLTAEGVGGILYGKMKRIVPDG